MRASLLLVLLFSCTLPASSARASDAIELLFLGEDKPSLLWLNVKVDGQEIRTTWRAYVDGLFERLDANDDQSLSAKELLGVPTPLELIQAGLAESPDEGVTTPDLSKRKKATRADLHGYYQKMGVNGFSSRVIKRREAAELIDPVTREPLSSGFFEMVDRNKDRMLSAEELKKAYSSLQKFDENDDESISVRELGMAFSLERIQQLPRPPRQATKARFVVLSSAKPGTAGRAVVGRYDKNDDNKLSRMEFWSTSKAFAKLDENKNKTLDVAELDKHIQALRPAAVIRLNVGVAKPGRVSVSVAKSGDQNSVKQQNPEMSLLRLHESQIDVVTQRSGRGKADAKRYKRLFAATDTDKNGYLNLDETRRFRNFRATFEAMDRNHDEKVFIDEMISHAVNQRALADAHISLLVTEQGRDLVEILDVNRDFELSRREMLEASSRLQRWDKNGDGKIAQNEVPQQFLLSVGQSTPELLFDVRRATPAVRSRPQAAAPSWFRNMDRNGDGDLSRREFLGTTAVFQKFDKNRDGLVSPNEVKRAK